MSRNSQRNRKNHSKKKHGRSKIVTQALRRSNNRKRCQSNKKRQRAFKRGKTICTICMNTLHGARKFLDCGHILHRSCFNRLLKEKITKCPNCRKDISRNIDQRMSPVIQEILNDLTYVLLYLIPASAEHQHRQSDQNLDMNSDLDNPTNLDSLNMDLFNPTSNFDNPSTALDNPSSNLNNLSIDGEDQSSDPDNSSTYMDDRSYEMDNSGTDSNDSSNFDNPITDAPTPSSYFDIPGPAHPRPSRYLNDHSVELPVLFVPVLCCRCELGSNTRSEQDFESNENSRSGRIIENEELPRNHGSSENNIPGRIAENDEALHRNFESTVNSRSRILENDEELHPEFQSSAINITGRILENDEELHRNFLSNENIKPRRILWEDIELERQIGILRMLLEGRDFTLNVLNSPAELDRFNAESSPKVY